MGGEFTYQPKCQPKWDAIGFDNHSHLKIHPPPQKKATSGADPRICDSQIRHVRPTLFFSRDPNLFRKPY